MQPSPIRTSHRLPALLAGGLLAGALSAQWNIPVRVVLDGSEAADRQVLGLADPSQPDAAISADAVRAGVVNRAVSTGSTTLVADLDPAPAGYLPGMVVTVFADSANRPGARIDLNGLGPQDIVKAGGLPLDSADLLPGIPARLIHDGSVFRLLTGTTLPCPPSYHVGGREFCVADSSDEAVTFYEAINACVDRGARLCRYAEWLHACLHDPAFIGTVLDYEWVDDAANNVDNAKRIGNGGDGLNGTIPGINCRHGGTTVVTNQHRYRCCTHR